MIHIMNHENYEDLHREIDALLNPPEEPEEDRRTFRPEVFTEPHEFSNGELEQLFNLSMGEFETFYVVYATTDANTGEASIQEQVLSDEDLARMQPKPILLAKLAVSALMSPGNGILRVQIDGSYRGFNFDWVVRELINRHEVLLESHNGSFTLLEYQANASREELTGPWNQLSLFGRVASHK